MPPWSNGCVATVKASSMTSNYLTIPSKRGHAKAHEQYLATANETVLSATRWSRQEVVVLT
eukprot:1021885-Amphidinium_carterae.1